MPFHRFDKLKSRKITAHLSSAEGPVIDGRYIYFGLNQKGAGTGSELHYHPNELLIFVIKGKLNIVVGKDRRIAGMGTFVIIPPNVRHSIKATEDGDCAYLYIKDRTWTVVGIGADEAPPERPLTMDESEEIKRTGKRPDIGASKTNSGVIIEGVPDCYYSLSPGLSQPVGYGQRIEWITGERMAFGLFEIPGAYEEASGGSEHEQFLYVCSGTVESEIGGERKQLGAGDIAEVPRGASYRLSVRNGRPARFVAVKATPYLEEKLSAHAV